MSALAARRAAQAAQATPTTAQTLEESVPTAREASATPSLSDLDHLSEPEAGPSKRRKVSKRNARYFAPEDDEALRPASGVSERVTQKRSRRFSPSAPASDAEDGVDSSDDSSGEREVDEGRADWTVPSTPRADIVSAQIKGTIPTTTSRFKAVTGVNIQLLSAETLDECGVHGSGQGCVLSLSKQDVRLTTSRVCWQR